MYSLAPWPESTTSSKSKRILLGWKATTWSPMVVGPVGRGHRAPYCPHVRRQADWELRVMLEIPLLVAWGTGYSDLTHLPDLQAQDHCHL
jgi:hypothetical protein